MKLMCNDFISTIIYVILHDTLIYVYSYIVISFHCVENSYIYIYEYLHLNFVFLFL